MEKTFIDEVNISVFLTHIEITPYKIGDCPEIERMMSKYDKATHSWIPISLYIEDDTLYLPKGFSLTIIEKYFRGVPHKFTHCDINNTFKEGEALYPPKSRIQEDAINFLTSKDSFSYSARYNQLGLNIDTGDGKTYSAVTAILKIKKKAIIITHQEKLKTQWIKTFKEMTTFDNSRLCNISGTMVIDLILGNEESKEYKKATKQDKNGEYYDGADIYFVNHQTLNAYARIHGWKTIGELFKRIRVGIKVIDESHKFFENTFMIDCFTNTEKTFYLTATFGRSDDKELRIYNTAFSSVVRYGEETVFLDEKRKHINFVIVYFRSIPKNGTPIVRNSYGFSSYRYIDYELHESNGALERVLKEILKKTEHLEGKTLVISPKTDSVDHFAEYIRDLTDKEVGTVYSKNGEELNKINLKKDIISSTVKSVGEGTDIKGLRVLINLEPIGSKSLADQVRGRLREYDSEKDTFLFYPVDITLKEPYNFLKRILPIMKKKCKKIITIRIDV